MNAPPVASRAGRRAGTPGVVVALDAALCDPVPCDPADARATLVAEWLWCLRLPLPYPGTRSVNAFLQRRRDGWTLFDCGSAAGAGWAALERALGLAGARPRDIDRLVLTHLHPDHAGLAGEVVARTGCELVRFRGPDTANDALREVTLSAEARRRTARRVGVPADQLDLMLETPMGGDGRTPRPRADRLLEPGDEIDGWRVVEATGHSPNQMALLDGRTVMPPMRPTPRSCRSWSGATRRTRGRVRRVARPRRGAGSATPAPGPRPPDSPPAGRFACARRPAPLPGRRPRGPAGQCLRDHTAGCAGTIRTPTGASRRWPWSCARWTTSRADILRPMSGVTGGCLCGAVR